MASVTVVVPAFNASRTLERALASVLDQTVRDIEVIAIDDGSTDRTPEILRSFADADPRLRVLSQPNRGVARARNAGMAAARGDWIATIDADDLWHPRKIELQLDAAKQAGGNVVMVYGWSRRIDADDWVIADMGAPRHSGGVLHQLIASNFLRNASSAMFRRRLALDVGGFDPGLHAAGLQGAEDLKLYLALARVGRVTVAPHFLTGYRQIEGSMSQVAARMRKSVERVVAESEAIDTQVSAEVFDLARMNYDLYAAALALAAQDRRAFLAYVRSAMRRRPVDTAVLLAVNALWRSVAALHLRRVPRKFQDVDMDERMLMPFADLFTDYQAWAARRAAQVSRREEELMHEA